jgi:hypothetical protein
MNKLEKLVRAAGGRYLGGRRHARYLLDGVVITLKRTRVPCRQHVKSITALLRRVVRRRAAGT